MVYVSFRDDTTCTGRDRRGVLELPHPSCKSRPFPLALRQRWALRHRSRVILSVRSRWIGTASTTLLRCCREELVNAAFTELETLPNVCRGRADRYALWVESCSYISSAGSD